MRRLDSVMKNYLLLHFEYSIFTLEAQNFYASFFAGGKILLSNSRILLNSFYFFLHQFSLNCSLPLQQ